MELRKILLDDDIKASVINGLKYILLNGKKMEKLEAIKLLLDNKSIRAGITDEVLKDRKVINALKISVREISSSESAKEILTLLKLMLKVDVEVEDDSIEKEVLKRVKKILMEVKNG